MVIVSSHEEKILKLSDNIWRQKTKKGVKVKDEDKTLEGRSKPKD